MVHVTLFYTGKQQSMETNIHADIQVNAHDYTQNAQDIMQQGWYFIKKKGYEKYIRLG